MAVSAASEPLAGAMAIMLAMVLRENVCRRNDLNSVVPACDTSRNDESVGAGIVAATWAYTCGCD